MVEYHQIINVLKDDHRDVKLKSVGEDLWTFPKEMDNKEQDGSLSTLKDLLHKLDAGELSRLRCHFYWYEDNERDQEVSQRTETIDEVLQLSSFTESRFNDFIKNGFDYGYGKRKLRINSSDLALKIVNVEGHWMPFTLAPVLKSLLQKNGDISREIFWVSPAMKSIIYFFLCQVIKKIHTTLVIDITKDLLRDWHYYVTFADSHWFDVGFLKTYLEEITKAYFYSQVSKLEVEVPIVLQNKIEKHKAQLETCMKLRKSSLQQEFMKAGLNKLMKLQWKTTNEVHFD